MICGLVAAVAVGTYDSIKEAKKAAKDAGQPAINYQTLLNADDTKKTVSSNVIQKEQELPMHAVILGFLLGGGL